MNKKAMKARGIIPPLALVKNTESNGHNNNEGKLQPLQVDQPQLRRMKMPKEDGTAEDLKNAEGTRETTKGATITLDLDANGEHSPMRLQWVHAANAATELEIRKLALQERAREFDAGQRRIEQQMAFAIEDRKFMNRHGIPALKFVGGVGVVVGVLSLVGWLTGEDPVQVAADIGS